MTESVGVDPVVRVDSFPMVRLLDDADDDASAVDSTDYTRHCPAMKSRMRSGAETQVVSKSIIKTVVWKVTIQDDCYCVWCHTVKQCGTIENLIKKKLHEQVR